MLGYRLFGLYELFGVVYGTHNVVVASLLHHLVLGMDTAGRLLMTFRGLVADAIDVTILVIYETALINCASIGRSVYRWSSVISFTRVFLGRIAHAVVSRAPHGIRKLGWLLQRKFECPQFRFGKLFFNLLFEID